MDRQPHGLAPPGTGANVILERPGASGPHLTVSPGGAAGGAGISIARPPAIRAASTWVRI